MSRGVDLLFEFYGETEKPYQISEVGSTHDVTRLSGLPARAVRVTGRVSGQPVTRDVILAS